MTFAFSYIIINYLTLMEASSPIPCKRDQRSRNECHYPLLDKKNAIKLEVWTYMDTESQAVSEKPNLPMWAMANCTFPPAIDLIGSVTIFGNCSLPIPRIARERGGRALKATIIMLNSDDGSKITEAPFYLTRHRRKKVVPQDMPQNTQSYEMVPYLKYGPRQHVVVRLVEEYREYGPSLLRGDNIPMKRGARPGFYQPRLYVDEIALRASSDIEIAQDGTGRKPITFRVKLSKIGSIRDTISLQASNGIKFAEKYLNDEEMDEIKWFLSDENLFRFLLSQAISFVHIWLDILAFKNDIGFYVGRTDMGGLSTSSVVSHFFCSLIIFLYLLDGGRSSMIVLISVGSGVAADAFKAMKVLKPSLSSAFPYISFRNHLSDTEMKSTSYDRIATAYLGMGLYPLIFGGALYAKEHYVYSSWYSWLISNLANAVYMFGFISLCPQLYINYRLKSVAHMPWKVFVYKIFNTFIDDVFAFLIEMPLKHKIMTLRDDVVFAMFLYQAYIYRVDKSRPNEYGFIYEKKAEEIPAVKKEESAASNVTSASTK
eukprot:CAMPEP_0196823128 /NCGR_PEP_ID=MMETSP1362-20130617/86236_1 /TAXON_ID=163516 /ORGANISM="Leptocylindrus danicus, Strain CCMP1856" /LENGTH=542 /DNA_ID=CAMNT_0042202897 /DNA_START=409 /DNA_END=2037 /DNA_ORIENTATION=+